MKTFIATLITLCSLQASAAQILDSSSTYNKATDTIQLEVVYQGGCKDHDFEVRVEMCNRSIPASCEARLVDHTEDDACRGIVQKTIFIPAEDVVGSYEIDRMLIKGDGESSALIDFM